MWEAISEKSTSGCQIWVWFIPRDAIFLHKTRNVLQQVGKYTCIISVLSRKDWLTRQSPGSMLSVMTERDVIVEQFQLSDATRTLEWETYPQSQSSTYTFASPHHFSSHTPLSPTSQRTVQPVQTCTTWVITSLPSGQLLLTLKLVLLLRCLQSVLFTFLTLQKFVGFWKVYSLIEWEDFES